MKQSKIFVDIEYVFARQPIKLFLQREFNGSITFVEDELSASIIISNTFDYPDTKALIIGLSDNPNTIMDSSTVFSICPVPTDASEFALLAHRVKEAREVLNVH